MDRKTLHLSTDIFAIESQLSTIKVCMVIYNQLILLISSNLLLLISHAFNFIPFNLPVSTIETTSGIPEKYTYTQNTFFQSLIVKIFTL